MECGRRTSPNGGQGYCVLVKAMAAAARERTTEQWRITGIGEKVLVKVIFLEQISKFLRFMFCMLILKWATGE